MSSVRRFLSEKREQAKRRNGETWLFVGTVGMLRSRIEWCPEVGMLQNVTCDFVYDY